MGQLLQCAVYGPVFEEHLEASADSESSGIGNGGFVSLWPWASNLHELHWLPMCFQVWFKVLAITHELLFDIGLGYLKKHLSFMFLLGQYKLTK